MANKVDEMIAQARVSDEGILSPEEIITKTKSHPKILFHDKPKETIFPLIPPPEDNYQPPSNIVSMLDLRLNYMEEFHIPELKVSPDRVVPFY